MSALEHGIVHPIVLQYDANDQLQWISEGIQLAVDQTEWRIFEEKHAESFTTLDSMDAGILRAYFLARYMKNLGDDRYMHAVSEFLGDDMSVQEQHKALWRNIIEATRDISHQATQIARSHFVSGSKR